MKFYLRDNLFLKYSVFGIIMFCFYFNHQSNYPIFERNFFNHKNTRIMNCRILFATCLLFVGANVFAQSISADSRLFEKYDQEYLNELSINAPRTLDYLNFSADNAWFIAEGLGEKYESLPELMYINKQTGYEGEKVEDIDFDNLNIFSFYFEQGYQHRMYYRVGETGYIIGFYSIEELSALYNQQKGLKYE